MIFSARLLGKSGMSGLRLTDAYGAVRSWGDYRGIASRTQQHRRGAVCYSVPKTKAGKLCSPAFDTYQYSCFKSDPRPSLVYCRPSPDNRKYANSESAPNRAVLHLIRRSLS